MKATGQNTLREAEILLKFPEATNAIECVAGFLADRGWGQWTTAVGLALLLGSWWPIAYLHRSLIALTAGIVILDFAVQAVHVTNQSIIFAAHPQARSRVVAAYMIFYSAGSGTGAIASTKAYAHFGWTPARTQRPDCCYHLVIS